MFQPWRHNRVIPETGLRSEISGENSEAEEDLWKKIFKVPFRSELRTVTVLDG